MATTHTLTRLRQLIHRRPEAGESTGLRSVFAAGLGVLLFVGVSNLVTDSDPFTQSIVSMDTFHRVSTQSGMKIDVKHAMMELHRYKLEGGALAPADVPLPLPASRADVVVGEVTGLTESEDPVFEATGNANWDNYAVQVTNPEGTYTYTFDSETNAYYETR